MKIRLSFGKNRLEIVIFLDCITYQRANENNYPNTKSDLILNQMDHEIEKSQEKFMIRYDHSYDIVANNNYMGRNIELTLIGPRTDIRVNEVQNIMNLFCMPYKRVNMVFTCQFEC